MIRAVADTHAILWYLYNDPRLSAAAGAIMDSAVQAGDEIERLLAEQ
jgi:PIN domain nuclease of toxin-antitoxin system